MRKLLLAFLVSVGIVLCARGASAATPSIQSDFCVPPNVIHPLDPVASLPANGNWVHSETCSGNPGDNWTSGPLRYVPPTTSGLQFTTAAMTWYVQGQRLYMPQSTHTVAASQTTYYFLNPYTASWVSSYVPTPQPGTDLEFTVVSNGTGITSIVPYIPIADFMPPMIGGGVVYAQSSFNVTPDGTTDNTNALSYAFAYACNAAGAGLGGVVLQLPPGVIVTQPIQYPCAGLTLNGYGAGSGGGSPNTPVAIQAATTLKCKSSSSTPLLTIMPNSTTLQSFNTISNIGFDGNNDACQSGLVATGQIQPTFSHLSFVGFGGVAFEPTGGQIGGSAKGSVFHPHFEDINISAAQPGDGVGMQIDGDPTNGDVFGSYGGGIFIVQNANVGLQIGRNDHDSLESIQVVKAPGATAQYSMVIGCNSNSFYASNLLMTNPAHILGTSSCSGSGQTVPRGTTFYNYQTYENGAEGPVVDSGATIVMSDDHGNLFLAQNGGTNTPYICMGLQIASGSICNTGVPIMWSDPVTGALVLGVRGSGQSGHIEFCMTGCGGGVTPTNYDSFIDETGALAFGTVGNPSTETTYYGARGAVINGPITATAINLSGNLGIGSLELTGTTGPNLFQSDATSNTAYQFNNTGNSPNVLAAFQSNHVNMFTVSGQTGNGNFLGSVTAAKGIFSGPTQVASIASGTVGYVPPVYTAAGAGDATTEHFVHGTCTFTASVSCAVSFTSTAAPFTNSTSYTCWASEGIGTAQTYGFVGGNQANNGFTIYTTPSTSISRVVPWSCEGT